MAAILTGLEQVIKGFESAKYVKNNRNSDRLLRMIIFFIAFFFFTADFSSKQDACHMNFVMDLAHRRVSVAQW